MRKHLSSVFAQEFSSTIPRNNQKTTEKMTNRSNLKSAYEHFSTTLPPFPCPNMVWPLLAEAVTAAAPRPVLPAKRGPTMGKLVH